MLFRCSDLVRGLCLVATLVAASINVACSAASWNGVLRDDAGKPVAEATVRLRAISGDREYATRTSANGKFVFNAIVAGDYKLSIETAGKTWDVANPVTVKDGTTLGSA